MKKLVFESCVALVASRIAEVTATLADLRESAANETKSTAGDKHETALAMLQIEQKNVAGQLEVLKGQMAVLRSLAEVGASDVVVSGSLVLTNDTWYYLSVALGKIMVESNNVIVLSASSPLGKVMIGRRVGEGFEFQGKKYSVQKIS